MDELLEALKAVAEPTRLRIVALVRRTELTVSELCDILGQSQPRVSRHLKLLCAAGVLDRHAQGTRAYYRPASHGEGRQLLNAVVPLVDKAGETDASFERDMARLEAVRAERNEKAQLYFDKMAADWDRVRQRHVSDQRLEEAIIDLVDTDSVRELLDIGTGTGRMLEVLGSGIERGIGIDLNSQMLDAARSKLDAAGLSHCSVRSGDLYALDFDPGSFDAALLHHVLHFLDDPEMAIAQAVRTLRPGGRLVIVDFAPHNLDLLRSEYAHHWLGFSEEEIAEWCANAGLTNVEVTHLQPRAKAKADQLTVSIWVGTQRADAPTTYRLEAAS